MDTGVRTPQEIFNLPQYLVVPIFQRPYVWEEEHQWTPLWQDVRRIAELRLTPQGAGATHFLGAVVLQAQPPGINSLTARDLIDGQQRLTTIQLLMDAVALVLEESDLENHSQQLADLTHNPAHFVAQGDSMLKVRHTNRDHEPFDEVMNATPPVDYGNLPHGSSRIARAHQYFSSEVRAWLGQPEHQDFRRRASTLVSVLTQGLQIVTIELKHDENSQEIFETLNARGTPLTAADLIKNYVFQRLAAEGADTARAYEEDWPFDVPPGMPVPFRDLADVELVLPSPRHGLRIFIDYAARTHRVDLSVTTEMDSLTQIKSLVARGSGNTILSQAAVHDVVADGQLVGSPIADPCLTRKVYLVRSSRCPATAASRAVEACCRDVVEDLVRRGIWQAHLPQAADR